MNVLVTGAAGFIGSHLTERLLADGHKVTALIRYSSTGSVGLLEAARKNPALRIVLGDIADPRIVRQSMDGCDAVLHLAALIGIPYSYAAPASYVTTNVHGTLVVLEAARDLGVDRVVLTSTSEVYGTALTSPITEAHPRQAQSPYSASKIAADALGEAWGRSFGLPVVILRPFNTYGPRQSPRAVIPTIFGQLAAGSPTIRLGSLWPRRDFTFVSDTVAGFCACLEAPSIEGRTIHLGTGVTVSVGELASMCQEVSGREVTIEHDDDRERPASSEVGLLVSDPSLAGELLNWKPRTDLRAGLAITWESLSQAQHLGRGYAR